VAKYDAEAPKGEFVLILEGADEKVLEEARADSWNSISLEEHLQKYIDGGLTRKEALKKVADDRGLSKRDVYNSLLGK
jgi:16S rRNA (cytidine1402-2'-O)-methyltransferase